MIKENVKSNLLSKLVTNTRLNNYVWIFSFTVLTAVAAQIAIPVKPVPFTLQTLMVLLSGAFLGSKNGAYSQVLYLFFASIGFPIFANGAFGFAHLFGPTGGYLLAFPIGAFVTGFLIERISKKDTDEYNNNNYIKVVLSMFTGNILILFLGTSFLNAFYVKDLAEAIKVGAALFTIWMVVKVFAAATIYFGVSKNITRK